jgi:hypothetical protein
MGKITSLREQIEEADEWKRARLRKWLRQAERDYSWLQHWVMLT